jgi:hypothetical protein
MHETIDQLRLALAGLHDKLIEAEAELTDRLAEINAFELEFEAQVGHLIDALADLEKEIARYNERINIARNKQKFGYAYVSVEEQYRRAWQPPPTSAPVPPPQPLSPPDEAEIKRLYRQLARRFHPDLAVDEPDRLRRTQKMTLINNAYAARSLIELVTLAQEQETLIEINPLQPGRSEAQLVQALQQELSRCQARLRQIERELNGLRYRPSVEVSLEVKAAQRQGRDLLTEMAADLERKIARKTAERDMLKAQFDQLGPDQGFIPLKR